MKYIEVDEELYRHIASKTERIGESASDILRRLLGLSVDAVEQPQPLAISQPSLEAEPIQPVAAQTVPAVNDFSRLVDEHQLSQQKGAVGRFLFLLESLYQLAPEQFSQICRSKGAIVCILLALRSNCSKRVLRLTQKKLVQVVSG